MKALESTLRPLLPEATNLGGEDQNIDRQKLLEALSWVVRSLSRAYWLRAALAIVIIATLAYIALQFGDHQAVLLGSITGIVASVVGGIAAMRQVTDELSRARMLLDIAPELTREALTEVVRCIVLPR